MRYEGLVTNNSLDTAASGPFDVVFPLPLGVTLAGNDSSGEWLCAGTTELRCTYVAAGPLDATTRTERIRIDVTVDADAPDVLFANAILDTSVSPFVDPNPDNDTITVLTAVIGGP